MRSAFNPLKISTSLLRSMVADGYDRNYTPVKFLRKQCTISCVKAEKLGSQQDWRCRSEEVEK